MFFETIKMALNSLSANKMRSLLTMISIVIGICIVIIAMTILEGFRNNVIEGASILASDVFQVQQYPQEVGFNHSRRREKNPPVEKEIAQAIRERCDACGIVGEEVWEMAQVIKSNYGSTDPSIAIAGAVPEYSPNNTEFVEHGRFISYADVYSGSFVTVIGPKLAEQLFPGMQAIGRTLKIKGYQFEVIGILENKGQMFGNDSNLRCVIPVTTWEKLFGKKDTYNITIKAKSPELFDVAREQVRGIVRVERRLKPTQEDNFGLRATIDDLKEFNNIANAIALAAIAICSISLLVGGIGVMNIMLVSVTERTREIGIRKALGAKKRTVLTQFLLEAMFLTILGGLIGILIGVGIGNVISQQLLEFKPVLPTTWIIIAVSFCASAGILAGLYPAFKAANLSPIEALRYE
ncbi:ABC transporter permease [bacterium]|nr:ABC transporter permease [bacterium]